MVSPTQRNAITAMLAPVMGSRNGVETVALDQTYDPSAAPS